MTQAAEKAPQVGDPAPAVRLQDETGKVWDSSQHFGKKVVVIYFYPADFTGGCTKQACSFRDDMGDLQKLGVEVVGVSGDTVENHKQFKEAYDLNYTLLADTEGKMAEAFGVPYTAGEKTVTKELDGKTYTLTRLGTAKRWTFVVGPEGKIVYKNENVNPEQDSQEVAKVVKNLKKNS